MKKASWFIFLGILAVSCLDDPDCYLLNNNIVGVTFRVIGSGKAWTIPLTAIRSDNTDSTFTPDHIRLNYYKEQSRYIFEAVDGNRSLDLGYTVQSQFVSEDCGTRFMLSGLQIMGQTGFDSVRIVNATPGNVQGAKNIEVFRCPQSDTIGISFRQLRFAGGARTSAEAAVDARVDVPYAGAFDTLLNAAVAFLPVDLDNDSTTYTFTFTDGYAMEARNLSVRYSVSRESRYKACLEKNPFFVDSLSIGVPSGRFDSVSIATNADGVLLRSLDDPAITNINIYRCPESNLVNVAFVNATGGANPVAIESITTDYSDAVFRFAEPVSTVTLPLNAEAAFSTFYINYGETQDTLSLGYSRTDRVIFDACGAQKIFYNLTDRQNLDRIEVVEPDTLQYPPITHIEIIPD